MKIGKNNITPDKDAHITLETKQLMYKYQMDELEIDIAARWAAKKGKLRYIVNVASFVIPETFYMNKGKLQIESDSKVRKNPLGKIGFGGQQTHTKFDIDFAFRLGSESGKRESLKMAMETSFAKNMDKGVLKLTVDKPSFAPNFDLKIITQYQLAPNLSTVGFYIKSGVFEVKTQVGYQSVNTLKKVNGIFQMADVKYGIESEWEIVNAKNVRILITPFVLQNSITKRYPTQLLFKDQSDDKLNMVLDIALTGLMPKEMSSSGQDDTYTLTIKLQENIEAIYKFSAEVSMHDFMQTNQKTIGYAAEMTIMGTDMQQGGEFKDSVIKRAFYIILKVRFLV